MLVLPLVDEDSAGDVSDDVPEPRDGVNDAMVLSDALGPGLGDPLLLQPATSVAATVAAAAKTHWNVRISRLVAEGDAHRCGGDAWL